MSYLTRVVVAIFYLSSVSVLAQQNVNREFLRSIDAQKRADVMSRHALQIRSEEYFANPQKFEIYEFDTKILEAKNEIITITPVNGPSIEILSNGVHREPDNGWFLGRWSGDFKDPKSQETYSAKLTITTWAIDEDGRLGAPDPNREATLAQLESENFTVLEASYSRLDEKLVYSMHGMIVLPDSRTVIRFVHPHNEFNILMVYELDESKMLIPSSDSIDGPDASSEFGDERIRRYEAYQAHINLVKQELQYQE